MTRQMDEEELMTGMKKKPADVTGQDPFKTGQKQDRKECQDCQNQDCQTCQKKEQDSEESRDFRMQLLNGPEFHAFMDRWDESSRSDKYNRGVFNDAWVEHCRGLQLGIIQPLADQKPTERRIWLDSTGNREPSRTGKLTAGRYKGKDAAGNDIWESEKPIEPDSKSGLTAGRYKGKDAAGHDQWET